MPIVPEQAAEIEPYRKSEPAPLPHQSECAHLGNNNAHELVKHGTDGRGGLVGGRRAGPTQRGQGSGSGVRCLSLDSRDDTVREGAKGKDAG